MKNRTLCTLGAVILFSTGDSAGERRPNVLFIAVDDLRPQTRAYGEVGMHTPGMDRLAGEGRLFHRHYVQVPTCGASRYSLLTGQYPKRPESLGNHAFALFEQGHAPASLPEWFRQNGYYTMQTGKVSHSPDGFRDDRRRIAEHGVPDSYRRAPHLHFTNPEDPEVPRGWDAFDTPVGQWQTGWGAFFGYAGGATRNSGESPAVEFVEGGDDSYPDGLMADAVVAALSRLRDRDEPFFYAVGFYKPHLPFTAPKSYWDHYDRDAIELSSVDLSNPRGGEMFGGYSITAADLKENEALARELIHGYFASVSYVDAQIGKVLDALDALGLAENTIVVLWGDHGFHLGELGFWGKHTLHEHSLRSAFIVRRPGMDQPGVATRSIVGTIDIYPTLVELAGLPMPEHLDGLSFAAAVDDPSADPVGFAAGFWRRGHSLRTDRHRLVDQANSSWLFDHRQDPVERQNVAKQEEETVTAMRGQLQSILEARKAR